jgi:hypothetical protein
MILKSDFGRYFPTLKTHRGVIQLWKHFLHKDYYG